MPYIQDCIATAARPAARVKHTIRVWLTAIVAVFAFLLLGSAVAADARKPGAKSGASSDERAACMSPNVDRAACLREIGAARQEARRGGLTDASGDFRQNALRRCEVFERQDERQACERRALGEGSLSGSVEEGGVLRQTKTVETVQQGAPAPAPLPSMQPGAPQTMPAGGMPGGMTR